MIIKNLYLILEMISGKSGGLFPKKFCKSSEITQEYQIAFIYPSDAPGGSLDATSAINTFNLPVQYTDK